MTASNHQAKRLIEAFLALIVGRRVPVRWGAEWAGVHAPSGTVYLPQPRVGDDDEVALLTRLAVHEAGHLTKTDAGWTHRLAGAEAKDFFNALEDARMEHEQCIQYPGAGLILRRGLDRLLENIATVDQEHYRSNPIKALSLDLLIRAFLRVQPHEEFKRHAAVILPKVATQVTPEQRLAVDEAVEALVGATSSLDAEAIAAALVARLREAPPPEPQKSAEQANDENNDKAASDEQEPAGANGDGGDSQDETSQPEGDEPSQSKDEGGTKEPTDRADGEQAESAAAPNEDATDDAQASSSGSEEQQGSDGADGADASDNEPGQGNQPQGGEGGDPESADASAAAGGAGGAPASTSQPGDEPGGQDAEATSTDGVQQRGEQSSQLPAATGESMDLGSLLRRAHVTAYGGDEPTKQEDTNVGTQLTQGEIERLGQLLSQEQPEGDLNKLFEQALAVLAESIQEDPSEDETGAGASMSLAGPSSGIRAVDARSHLQGVQSRLVVVLQREFQDRKRRPTKPSIAGARVLAHRYWRLPVLADTKVFAMPREVTGIDAAATIFLDKSGTMENCMQTAVDAALAFSMALQRLNVRTRLVVFPGECTVVQEVQRFGEPARSAIERAKGVCANGGTPTGAALLAELPELLQQRKLKKFAVIITDGQAGDRPVLARAMGSAEAQGVRVLGIGIGLDITDTIPASARVNDVQELPEALAELFRRNMLNQLVA
jgi:hypothetical protein